MNFNLLSSPLFFIGTNVNYLNIQESLKNGNNPAHIAYDLKSRISIPTYKPQTRYKVQYPLPDLLKKVKNGPDLVTYTGSGQEFADLVKIPSDEELISSVYKSEPLINTLSKVFAKEGLSKLNEYQNFLFDELALGRDVIMHSYTSSGKTFSILLYLVLRHYYQLYPQCLTSKRFGELLNHIKDFKTNTNKEFKRKYTPFSNRVLILCPTKELAVQCANQIVKFTDGKEDVVHLIIDEHDLCPEITPEKIFVVGSSNQVESYFLNKDPKHTRSILQSFDYVFLDEMDRLIKVANQYARERKKRLMHEKPGSSYNICQSLLTISPNKLRFICASASVTRHHIRKINALIGLYRNERNNITALIRKKTSATNTGRYVSIPETVKHFYKMSKKSTLESKVNSLAKLLEKEEGNSIVFLSSGSLLKLQNELKRHGIECKILHWEMGIKDVSKEEREASENTIEMIKKLQNEIKNEKGKFVVVASTDSARGIHLPTLDSVYILGRPRNVNECVEVIEKGTGRVGRCSRTGRCITIDSRDGIKILLSWQRQTNTNIEEIFEDNKASVVNTGSNSIGDSGDSNVL